MSDLVHRLRQGDGLVGTKTTLGGMVHDKRCLAAADEIERLRAALKMIKDWGQRGGCDPIHLSMAAEGALEGGEDG